MGLKESGLRGSLRATSSVLPAFFDVTITNTNNPVQEGDILTVDYSADNTGDAQDIQDIRLEIDSVQEDVDPDVMLAGGASTTGTLEWDTTGEDEAEYTATVLSDDDSDSVIVEIEAAIPDAEVLDDWADGEFTSNRDDFDTTPYQFASEDEDKFTPSGSRPEWEIVLNDTDPSVSDSVLTFGSDDELKTVAADPTKHDDGFVWEFRFNDIPDDGGPNISFWKEDSDNRYRLLILNRDGDTPRLQKIEDGDDTVLIDANDSWDGGPVRVELNPDDTWELFVSGVSQGTQEDSFKPDPNETFLEYTFDGPCEFDSMAYYPQQDD